MTHIGMSDCQVFERVDFHAQLRCRPLVEMLWSDRTIDLNDSS